MQPPPTAPPPGAADAAPAVRLRGVTKRYRRGLLRPLRAVLDAVSLEVRQGETVAVIGPNGSGKSTLLRLVAGLEPPDAGSVEVLGHAPASRAARASVGLAGDVEALPGELRAGETLRLFGGLARLRGAELHRRVRAALAHVGLADEERTELRRFSLGMKRRFGLALATFTEPPVLLLDEPSAGLDAPGHVVLHELVEAARARGAALLFASHQLDDLTAFAERVVVLVAGRVVASGTPGELVDRTRSGRLELDDVDARELDALAEALGRSGAHVAARGPGAAALRRLFAAAEPDRAPSGRRGA